MNRGASSLVRLLRSFDSFAGCARIVDSLSTAKKNKEPPRRNVTTCREQSKRREWPVSKDDLEVALLPLVRFARENRALRFSKPSSLLLTKKENSANLLNLLLGSFFEVVATGKKVSINLIPCAAAHRCPPWSASHHSDERFFI